MKKFYFLPLLCLLSASMFAQWQSSLVKMANDGKLTYQLDADGYRIPDFSQAGYKNGQDIPDISMPDRTLEISPLPGEADNTAHIQKAINEVGSYVPDEDGFRGIVYLNPGKYYLDGTVQLKYTGVILRGVGRGNDPASSTILYARNSAGKAMNIVEMGSGKDHRWGNGNGSYKKMITTSCIMPGDYSFEVENTANYKVGDLICIKYPTTDEWMSVVKNGGNTDKNKYWKNSQIDISYHRYITHIEGNKITIDAPVFYSLDQKYSQPYTYKFTVNGSQDAILQNIGIEDMRIEFERTSASDTATPDQNCILMRSLENSWAKNLYLTGFVHAGIKTFSVTRSTIEGCSSIAPSGYRAGGNHYNFENYHRSQLILIKNCRAKGGRHHYIANGGGNVSGNVVLNMTSVDDEQNGISESHRLWAQGILFDNWKEVNEKGNPVSGFKIGMYLRCNLGSGHGWGGTNSVFWNCDVGDGGIYLDKVPTGQNYAIGCTAKSTRKYVNTDSYTTGYIEGTKKAGLVPASLYEAQLDHRKKQGPPVTSLVNPSVMDDAPINVISRGKLLIVESKADGIASLYSMNGLCLQTEKIHAGEQIPFTINTRGYYVIKFLSNQNGVFSRILRTSE